MHVTTLRLARPALRLARPAWAVRGCAAVRSSSSSPAQASLDTPAASRGQNPLSASALAEAVSAMSCEELHGAIVERSAPPPANWFVELTNRAAAHETPLLLSAHAQYLKQSRFIGKRHSSALVRACARLADWERLETSLADSRKLQLVFSQPGALLYAFNKLAEANEHSRLSRVHAALPGMHLGRMCSGVLHDAVVTTLADAGELGDAAAALETASALSARERGNAHALWLRTFSHLAEAQLGEASSAGVAGAARTLRAARDELARRGFAPWVAPQAKPQSNKLRKHMAFVEKMKAAKKERRRDAAAAKEEDEVEAAAEEVEAAEEEEAASVPSEFDPTIAYGRLLAVAAKTCVAAAAPPPPAAEVEQTEASDGDGDSAEAAAAEGEVGEEAAEPIEFVDPLPYATELAEQAGAEARAAALAMLAEQGVLLSALPESLAAALAE